MGGKFRFSGEQWRLLIALGIAKISISLTTSLQGPLFPREAEQKGATASEYGLVFGTYALVSFISCPIYGHYINRIGVKNMLSWGIFLTAISIIGFGLLDLIESHVPFITMAFILRILESLGTAASMTALFSVTIVIFYDSIATSFAITESFMATGFMFGPLIAGYLYQVGGYMLPFVSMGVLLLIEALLIYFTFPDIHDNINLDIIHVRMTSVLTILPVFLNLFGIATASILTGFITSTLEPHLRQFHLTPVATGSIFMIGPAMYVFLAPLVGYLCDTTFYPKKVVIFGGVLVLIGCSLVGPAPFLPFDTTLWVLCVGLVFNGIGHGCLLLPTFIDAIHSAVAYGLPNDMALYGVVSGLATSAYSLGDAIGPSVAGILVDSVGFRYGTLFLVVMLAILVVSMGSYVCMERRRRPAILIETTLNYESLTKSDDYAEKNSGCNSKTNRVVYYNSI